MKIDYPWFITEKTTLGRKKKKKHTKISEEIFVGRGQIDGTVGTEKYLFSL